MLRHTNQKRSGSGEGGMEISESNVTSRCKSCVQWAKPPSAGRSTMQLIDGSRFCCRWRLSTTTTPSHSQSKSPLSQGRETGEAHRRNKSPLPPLPAVGSPAARLASFQEFAVRLLHHLLPPLPPPSPLGCCGFKYVPWTECVCAVVPVYPTGGTRAQRGRHSAMVCVCRCFPAGSHGDSTVHVGLRCFGRDDGEQVGYAILPAVVCMQTAWTVRSLVVARMGEDDFDGPHVCLQLHVISFFPSPMSASVVMPPSPNRALW